MTTRELSKFSLPVSLALVASACGYHVGTHADTIPKTIKTIAIPAFANTTPQSKLARLLTADVTREFISRTHYNIVAEPDQADALLQGAVVNFINYPTIFDPVTFRATGVQVVLTLQLHLSDRHTGKMLFSKTGYEFRERFEISVDPTTYFDESGTAIQRLSRDAARSIVSAILENF